MKTELSDTDRRVLDQLQREVPLVREPFAELARRVGDITEAEALDTVRKLSGPPPAPIRQISAIFDSKSLGYQSCLVAAKVETSRVAEAAGIINRHPGVSHNYQREHAFNLWFTLAVPPDSRLGLERTVERLRDMTGATQMRLMPSLKLYKIGVKFDLGVEGDAPSLTATSKAATAAGAASPVAFTAADKRMIRVLQQHLPATARPFDGWTGEAGVSLDDLLAAAVRFRDAGVMRRFSAVLRHRSIGVSANAMGVWVIPPDRQDDFGRLAAGFSAVSHCYLRPSYPPDWPYSIFTMVHGKTRVDCEATLAAISLASGVNDYTSLYSTEEFKKVRVKYFVDDIEQWEAAHADACDVAAAATA
jgi:DNA-binding Lrp family transcriptional regulator